jgi:hypothetical protein
VGVACLEEGEELLGKLEGAIHHNNRVRRTLVLGEGRARIGIDEDARKH